MNATYRCSIHKLRITFFLFYFCIITLDIICEINHFIRNIRIGEMQMANTVRCVVIVLCNYY